MVLEGGSIHVDGEGKWNLLLEVHVSYLSLSHIISQISRTLLHCREAKFGVNLSDIPHSKYIVLCRDLPNNRRVPVAFKSKSEHEQRWNRAAAQTVPGSSEGDLAATWSLRYIAIPLLYSFSTQSYNDGPDCQIQICEVFLNMSICLQQNLKWGWKEALLLYLCIMSFGIIIGLMG